MTTERLNNEASGGGSKCWSASNRRWPVGKIVEGVARPDTLTPADRYQELFVDVQMSRVFEDSKTFVDCVPLKDPEEILDVYRQRCFERNFDLPAFVDEHFAVQQLPPDCFNAEPERTLEEHIESLWPVLTRRPQENPPLCSILPLPCDFLVPGGRFTELYYWDSYFILLGLLGSEYARRNDLLQSVADNFAYLIDVYGHIPNGNRTYYLSRSQPPLFSMIVELLEGSEVCEAMDYLPHLRLEYAWWMDGAGELRPGDAHRRAVRMPDGAILNRYWDDRDSPREESYAEDVLTARRSHRPVHEVYRDLRAGAESGWDFSSRWLDDPEDISTIRTTGILPVDLNCFLLNLETTIARLSERKGDGVLAEDFRQRAAQRRAAIDQWFWSESEGAFFDYDWQKQTQRENLTAATVTPLFVGCASDIQAGRVAEIITARMLAPGGISTTEFSNTGEQWDRPNGWAPLHWMAVQGFSDYGHNELAHTVAHRWLLIVSEIFEAESKMVEKYILRPTTEHATGGEYPLQDGFGWTNGVVARLLREHPEDPATACRAGRRL
ncbi:alpha,alpha-trehalase TreF [Proteobacteria bacterium 005FR1]|nr:alpha,alpha-trehalase TreF [Proteobacteria bacterium 005FR1]